MFNLNTRPEFTRAVNVHTPAGEATRLDTFQATFRVLDDTVLAEHNTTTLDGQKELLRAATVSLGDIIDDNKQPVEYSPELLEAVMSNAFARNAMLATFSKVYAEEQVGNSNGRAGRGQTAL